MGGSAVCALTQECQELQLFQAVLAWLLAHRNEQQDISAAAAQLLPLIRFPLMSVDDLQACSVLLCSSRPTAPPAALLCVGVCAYLHPDGPALC